MMSEKKENEGFFSRRGLSESIICLISVSAPGLGHLYIGKRQIFVLLFPIYIVLVFIEFYTIGVTNLLTYETWSKIDRIYHFLLAAITLIAFFSILRHLRALDEFSVNKTIIPYVFGAIIFSSLFLEKLSQIIRI